MGGCLQCIDYHAISVPKSSHKNKYSVSKSSQSQEKKMISFQNNQSQSKSARLRPRSTSSLPEKYVKFFESKILGKFEILSASYICPISHGMLDKSFVGVWGPVTSRGALSVRRVCLVENGDGTYIPVSVKITDGDVTDEIAHDIKVSQKFKHQNLMKMYGYWIQREEREGKVFRVYEYIDGGNLRIMKKKMTSKEKYIVALKICDAMMALEKEGMVHGGLSTINILVSNCKNYVKVGGFESSSVVSDNDSNIKLSFDNDPEFISPERFHNLDLTKDSIHLIDIYAFGIILWECFSNEMPFFLEKRNSSGNYYNITKNIHEGKQRPSMEKLITHIREKKLMELIKKCWSEDPSQRPSSWKEIKDSLEESKNNYFNYQIKPIKIV